ncbi:MAG: hypothetical protein C0512_12085 [Flavobacterium sp.]|nr:hypothetical protein [Flavobacterium sp.]
MDIENNFEIGQIVYLKHDVEQKPRMITEIRIRKYNIVYEVSCGTDYSVNKDFELSKEKNPLL